MNVDTLIVFSVGTESGRSAMPRCTPATSSADILHIMRSAPSTRSGRERRVVPPSSFGSMLSKNGSVPRWITSSADCKRLARASGVSDCALVLRSEEHTSELQSHLNLVCRLLLEKKKKNNFNDPSHIDSTSW